MPPSGRPSRQDWAKELDRLLQGDRLALAKLTRLVASFLARWNAWDFRDDWDDLIQEVLVGAARAVQDGTLRDRSAAAAYLKSTTRFKYADRIQAHLRRREDEHLPWEDVMERELDPPDGAPDPGLARDLREALDRLSEKQRRAVVAVHLEGRSYEEAAAITGIPLGSLKRHLRDGLARLRERLESTGLFA